ncbi:MAG TPA: dihydroorotase [Terriglobia bacterium]|nr:dihydroorotase [Terriglobia bacterium]
MPTILIKAGRVVSPEDGLDAKGDILVEGGRIRQIAPHIDAHADHTIDARGQIVSPGFIDIHVHLREPGGEISETLETGLAAAAAGGFTAVCPMPNTRPVNDSPELTRFLVQRASEIGMARVFPIAAVSEGNDGERLADFAALSSSGAVAFSDDGRPVRTAGLMLEAMRQAQSLGLPIIDHCEDPTLSAGGAVNAGPVASGLGLKGIPNLSEDVCVARDLILAQAAGAHLHVAHLSTSGSLELVRAAKRRGTRVTCEVTPHHFTLTDDAVTRFGTHAKMNPPLRSAADVEALRAGLADGTVDAIATDHAPHAPQLKARPLPDAPFGITGLETALPLCLMQLVETGRISLSRLIVLLSTQPARIINQPLGRIHPGALADLTVFDSACQWTYRADEGHSKSRNTPFDGWTFTGAVTATIVDGKVVYRRD